MANPFEADDDDNPFAAGEFAAAPAAVPRPAAAPAPAPSPAPSSISSPAPAPFNPFDTGASVATSEPLSHSPAPSTTRSAQGGYRDATGGFHSFADMDRREDELRKREAELANLEEQVRNGTYQRPREKNFPPYLHWWSWHPERDLPPDALGLMRRIRVIFMVLFLVYLLNVAGCIGGFIAKDKDGEPIDDFGAMSIALSLVYCFVLVPLSFELSFFPMYRGILRGAALRFFCGMAVYVIWFLVLVFVLVGVPGDLGTVGFIMMINAMKANGALGVIALIFCILGCITAVLMVLSFIALVRYYRANGLVAKAKQEGAQLAVEYAREHPDQAIEIAKAVS